MMKDEFVLRELDISQDADKLAVMWKESDEQWPGTWSGGVDITTAMVTEWYEREKTINVFVFESGDQIVGYCSFNELSDEKNVGYVAVLNVHPAYQGRSLGRRLLQRCLERCSELGFHLLTLGTWSGNLKSVPLYKKTGFYWVPDTSAWMLNYIPSILNLRCAQPFFSRHDWYQSFVRELRQVEDEERWEGMKVFTYHWEADGEGLTVWADREAHTLTGVETDSFLAAAIADNIEPPKGLPTKLRWRLQNKQDRPMSVSLIASGTEHIKLDYRTTLVVAPGEKTEIEATVEIDADTPDVRRHKKVPAVRTLLIIDGEVLELGTGLRPQVAVAAETFPRYFALFPGVPKTVHLQLQSHLIETAEATVSLVPSPGLTADWTEGQVPIPAKSFAAFPITLEAATEGVYSLRATVYFEGGNTLPKRLEVFCLPPGGVLADQSTKETRIENESVRLILRPHGGEMIFYATDSGQGLGGLVERLGPPFWPSELEDKEYEITLRENGSTVTAVMTADTEDYAELTLRREVTLGAGPLVRVSHALSNHSRAEHKLQVSRSVRNWQRDEATLTVPLRGGVVQSRMTEFPAAEEDISKKPEAFSERWAAVTSRHGTLGLVWDDNVEENEFHWGINLMTSQLTCEPQRWTTASELYLYVGPGDWRAVRHHARRLAGTDHIPEPIAPQTRRVYDARLDPAPLVTLDDRTPATLVVENLRSRLLTGRARLALPDGVSADRDTFEVIGVAEGTPLGEEIALSLEPAATAYEGQLDLETRLFDASVPVPVIRLGDREQVSVSQGETGGQSTYVVDNGRTRFTVAPNFSGALTRWEEDGVNHLLSPFPVQEAFGWISPWYGGVTPMAVKTDGWDFPGKLHRESFGASAVDVPDGRGIPWRGVRLSADMQREQLTGLRIELDYLTVGHSNVLKLIYRIRNQTTANRRLEIGWLCFWQPDGNSERNVLHSEDIQRKHTPWESMPEVGHWGAVVNPDSSRAAIVISSHPTTRLFDWGEAGGHLGWTSRVDVGPSAVTEHVCYLVLCSDLAEARRYTWLRSYV